MTATAPVRSVPRRPGPVAVVLLAVVRAYSRWLSPLLGPHCRFLPTCSAYAAEALTAHGAARGGWLAVRRLARCHPFHPGGLDPVPPPGRRSATMEAAVPADSPTAPAVATTVASRPAPGDPSC